MPPRRSGTVLRVCVLASALLALAACGFGDLFRSAGPRDVTITFAGDSVLFVGDTAAFAITVTANGTTIPNPNLTIESSDTTVLELNGTRDSLYAVGNGNARLIARLNDPIFTDSLPTVSIRIRVHG